MTTRTHWQASELRPSDLAAMSPTDRARYDPTGRKVAIPKAYRAKKGRRKMTETEKEYACHRRMFFSKPLRFEPMTLHMQNGHSYTPDFVEFERGKPATCIEVKGAYKLGSYQRARLAFDQCRKEFPCFRWIWAEKQQDGTWKETEE